MINNKYMCYIYLQNNNLYIYITLFFIKLITLNSFKRIRKVYTYVIYFFYQGDTEKKERKPTYRNEHYNK